MNRRGGRVRHVKGSGVASRVHMLLSVGGVEGGLSSQDPAS